MKFKLLLTCIFLFSCLSYQANSQTPDSMMALYNKDFQQEKMHIHFDKSYYTKGETIWLKAYLLAGTEWSAYSKNIYFDWYDDKGNLIKHVVCPVNLSSARSQFLIPENYSSTTLRVVAYTKWMTNWDSAFFYTHTFKLQTSTANPETVNTQVLLLPEGGHFIAGVNNRVAIKATINDFPIQIFGVIKNKQGEILDSAKTTHFGMGTCNVIPDLPTDSLYFDWQDELGRKGKTKFPVVEPVGIALRLEQKQDKIAVQITRSDSVISAFDNLYLLVHEHQYILAKVSISLNQTSSVLKNIPTRAMSTGVVQFSVVNSQGFVLAERVAFVMNNDFSDSIQLTTVQKEMGKRKKNVFNIALTDSLFTHLSVSVCNELDSSVQPNIWSSLLLQGDIRGKVYNPNYYFNGFNTTKQKELDLVMLTNGWRKVNWSNVYAQKLPTVKALPDTEYLALSGKIFTDKKDKIQPDQKIILLAQPKNSKKTQSLILPVLADKSFHQSDVLFYDTLKIFYQFSGKNNSLNDEAEVSITSGSIKPFFMYLPKIQPSVLKQSMDSIILANQQKNKALLAKIKKQNQGVNLDDVVVKTRVKSNIEKLDEFYSTGVFASSGDYQFDIGNNTQAQSAMDIFSYLTIMVPGLTKQTQEGETVLKWRGKNTAVFLDELSTDPDVINSLSVADIAYVKVFRPPFFGASGGGAGGAISIYTKKGNDGISSGSASKLPYKLVEGYTAYKEYISKDYSSGIYPETDVRSTVYWNPYLLLDGKKNNVDCSFYTNDVDASYKVVVEGMNENGKLIHKEFIIK